MVGIGMRNLVWSLTIKVPQGIEISAETNLIPAFLNRSKQLIINVKFRINLILILHKFSERNDGYIAAIKSPNLCIFSRGVRLIA